MTDKKISFDEWSQLSEAGKQMVNKWALIHGYGLDIIPGPSGTFDPVCDYGALLTKEQMIEFIEEHTNKKPSEKQTNAQLWKQVVIITKTGI